MRLSLRWKMLFLVFALVMTPVVLLGISEYRTARALLTENVRVSARDALKSGVDVADVFLKSVEDAVIMLSQDASVQNVLTDPQAADRVLEIFKAYMESHEDVENVFYGTRDKGFHVYPPAPGGLPPGFDPTTRPWYPRTIQAGKITWTEPYIDTGSGKLVVSVAVPVYKARDNQPIGVVGIDVALDRLSAMISTRTVGESGYLVLLDQSGLVLAHPDPSVFGQQMADRAIAEVVLNTQAGEIDYNEGEEKFVAFSTLDRTGWSMGAMISYNEATDQVRAQLQRTLMIGFVLLLVGLGIGIVFSDRLLIKPVFSLVSAAEEISQGNFTTEVKLTNNDELGVLAQTFRKLQQDLGKLIGDVKVASDTTAELSRSVFRSSQEISASTEEMAATTNEFAGSVQQMSDHVQTIDEDGAAVQKVSRDGQELILKAVNQMKNIETSFGGLYQSVEQLGIQSTEIGKITDLIRGISDQTNLLALNAAIEAARAGDQGRGFAVVAEEVRSLAEQSAAATEQIANLLREVHNQINQVMSEANESIAEVKEGSTSVQIAGETFGQIGQAINAISARIQEVAGYALELSSGSEQMAAATEEQAATLQEITMSANDLAEQAGLLMELTEGFKI
ncbi:MAG: methyl-accepting chemotaxis protein [Firmicutes bacterium]|nr:methyl-accepting chemotaxis protein [Bacillota bacterium]